MVEKHTVKAEISRKISKKAFLFTLCAFLILPVLLLFIGFATGKFHGDTWFGIRLEEGKIIVENLVLLIVILFLLFFIPFAVYLALHHLKRKLTTLLITEKEVVAMRTPVIPVAKIYLRIPIDKIASVRKVTSPLFLYTGDEVCISTAASTFRIPFVLNADEVISFLCARVTKEAAPSEIIL